MSFVFNFYKTIEGYFLITEDQDLTAFKMLPDFVLGFHLFYSNFYCYQNNLFLNVNVFCFWICRWNSFTLIIFVCYPLQYLAFDIRFGFIHDEDVFQYNFVSPFLLYCDKHHLSLIVANFVKNNARLIDILVIGCDLMIIIWDSCWCCSFW